MSGSGLNFSPRFRWEKVPGHEDSNPAATRSSLHQDRWYRCNIDDSVTVIVGTGQFFFFFLVFCPYAYINFYV